MGNSSLLKGALFALCFLLVIALFMPKDCASKTIVPLTLHKTNTAPKGLRIESPMPPPAASDAAITWPAGLDAAHLQYMIEIDPHFTAPQTEKFLNDAVAATDYPLLAALQKLGYVEKRSDGTWGFTPDGMIHVSGTSTDGKSVSVPVAKRVYERAISIDCNGDQCTATFYWKWQPNEIGSAMQMGSDHYRGKATLLSSGGNWYLNALSDIQ